MQSRPCPYSLIFAVAAAGGTIQNAAADASDRSTEPPTGIYAVAPGGEFVTGNRASNAPHPPPVLTLPGTDWRAAGREESVPNWGDTEDLVGNPLESVRYPQPLSPAELASQGIAFGHSSLANTGPGLRHGARAGQQFGGLAKGLALNAGNMVLGQIAGGVVDWLSDQ